MYPITEAVKALFESEQPKVLRITGSTVKILPTDIEVYSGDTLIYQSGSGKRVQLYSGDTEVYDSNGTHVVILYSGDKPIFINDEAGMPIELEITGTNVLEGGFTIDRYSCNGDVLEIGTAIASELTLRLDNIQGQYDGVVFEGTELFVEIGIADWTQEAPAVNWIPCGYFTPDSQPRKMQTLSLTALDRMMWFEKTLGTITFPTTIAGLVGQACTACNITLATDLTDYPNSSVAVNSLPGAEQQSYTYRNIIQWCAGVMGANAWIDWNGELQFSWYDNATGYISTTANRFSSDLHENAITISGVVFEDTDEESTVYVAGTEDYALDLTGNILIHSDNANAILTAIYTKVGGLSYNPFNAGAIAAPYLWPMDRVTFTDRNGKSYLTLLTNVNFSLNGITALAGVGESTKTYSYGTPNSFTAQQLAQLRKIKSVTDSSISEAVANATAQITGATGGYVRFMYDTNGKMTEVLIMDTEDITTATKVWRWNGGGFGYSSNGYAGPYTTAITQDGSIVADFITTGILNAALVNVINLNADNITTGTVKANQIALYEYGSPFRVPDENDPSSLLPGQSIVDGWVVGNGSSVRVLQMDDVTAYRGQSVWVNATYPGNGVPGGYFTWEIEAEEGEPTPTGRQDFPPTRTYGETDSSGSLVGPTQNGENSQYKVTYTIPNDAVSFAVVFTVPKAKEITANFDVAPLFSFRYAANVGISEDGLQSGKFVVDRSGNVTSAGKNQFDGDVDFNAGVAIATPLAVEYGGTGCDTVDDIQAGKDGDGNVIADTYAVASGMFQYVSYSAQYSVAANSLINITANDLGITWPDGYTPIAYRNVSTGNRWCVPVTINAYNTGTANALQIHNMGSSAVTDATAYLGIVYARTELI